MNSLIEVLDSEKAATKRNTLDGSDDSLKTLLLHLQQLQHTYHVQICFRDLNYWIDVGEDHIPTIATSLKAMVVGSGLKHRVDILKNLTGN